jgi:hypothetical protein
MASLKKYQIVPAEEVHNLNYKHLSDDSIETTRFNLSKTLAIVEWIEGMYVPDGMDEEEILEYLTQNYNEWNEDTTVEVTD